MERDVSKLGPRVLKLDGVFDGRINPGGARATIRRPEIGFPGLASLGAPPVWDYHINQPRKGICPRA